jgi:thiol-disulfide isomerase/thioredoxin
MFHRVFAAIALEIGLALALLMWPTRVPASTTDSDLRKAASDFNLNDSKGFPLKLSDYKGRVVLLDFWATWCHGCKTEIPWYMEFQRKYKGRGLAVIGVSMDDDGWKSVRPFLREHQFNYPVVIGNQDLAKVYGVDSMPVTLLIDRQGKIADSYSGVVNKDGFEREIQTLLQERVK